MVNGDQAIYLRLIRVLLRTYTTELERFRDLLSADNPLELKELAHKLKGSSASFGAHRVRELASTLELAIRNQTQRGEIEQHCAVLISEMSVLCEAINLALAEIDRH